MWLIFRINKNKIEFFKKELTLKLKSETIFYSPKIIINKYFQNKLLKKEFNLLGDYVFCYNSNFSNLEIVNLVKYTRGCKYVLDSFWNSQNQISNFIRSLKKLENKDGYISRKSQIRILRDNVVIHKGQISSLKRFKEEVSEVKTGFECGVMIDNYSDIKVGDIIETFEEISTSRKL